MISRVISSVFGLATLLAFLLPTSGFAQNTSWATQGTVVTKDGSPFFAKGLDYAPTPIGGATYQPGVGDWFTPPWWTGTNDIGQRDLANFQSMQINALRTYFFWYWMPDGNLSYLAGITQDSPPSTNPVTGGPDAYTVTYDHKPFLDACANAGVYVLIGIGLDGGNCFNFSNPSVSGPYQNFYLQTAQKLAAVYGSHPAVMGFCLSNEQNNAQRNTDSRVWTYYKQMRDAVKMEAPNKLVTIAFQDDQTLYNGTTTVTDPTGAPSTPYNNQPVESVISSIVDVWSLNIYAGINTDFPVYQQHVINAGYGRPLYVTEWGVPAGKNVPTGAAGPPDGNATAQELAPAEQVSAGKKIKADLAIMEQYVSFISGAFYFEYSDEWWKNEFTLAYEQNASASPDWPEEWWGLFAVAPSNGRSPQNPDPNNPDSLTPRQPMVDAVSSGYQTIESTFQSTNASGNGPTAIAASAPPIPALAELISFPGTALASELNAFETPWGLIISLGNGRFLLGDFGEIELIEVIEGEGIVIRRVDAVTARRLFLPVADSSLAYNLDINQWIQIQEDEGSLDPSLPVLDLTAPTKRQRSGLDAPFPQVPIP